MDKFIKLERYLKKGKMMNLSYRYNEISDRIIKIPKFVDVIRYIKEKYGYGCSGNSIWAVLNIIGLSTDDGIRSYPMEQVTRSVIESLIYLGKNGDLKHMKKIVILNGSPRKNGYTASLIKAFTIGAIESGNCK